MLGIFGKKSDHPLADIKSAQQVLEDIPKNDALNAVQELTGWIETVVELADEFRLDHEYAVLRMFDETAQQFVRKLLRDYFTVQPLSKFQENRLWMVLNEFYTQSEIAHHGVLTRFRNGERGASGVKPELAILNARGIAALTGRLKMAVARYALVESVLWQHLSEFYGHAEMNGYRNDAVPLYAGVSGNTSVTQEFTALLTWYGVSAGVLSPLQEHITERLVAYASDGLTVYDQYNANGVLVFDLSQPTPPMRIAADATLHPALRFLVVGDAMAKFNELAKILDKGILPDYVHFNGANYEADMVREILHRLIANLTQPPPTRRNPRRKINVNLKVANGFFKMLEKTDLGLNFSSDAGDIWDVEDISATGFRSVVPLARADGIKIGSLIGSKPENVPHWGAGIVRRLSRDDKNNLHIGVEVLSTQISGVSLSDRVHTLDDEVQIAIYLNRPADTSGEAWLLMKPDTFSPHRSLKMELGGKGYLLLPLSLVETGDDYDLARFRRMEQEQDAAAE
ncbi:hypothetical protein GALL_123060 [mine drainage metagenome]|uniref:PilZ domain-containing protein n=1 Tax=mine drainage metagenome TaxID=410659 RepID=A0A1J5SC77_9ZZZZ